jgi:hypothetical protein
MKHRGQITIEYDDITDNLVITSSADQDIPADDPVMQMIHVMYQAAADQTFSIMSGEFSDRCEGTLQ